MNNSGKGFRWYLPRGSELPNVEFIIDEAQYVFYRRNSRHLVPLPSFCRKFISYSRCLRSCRMLAECSRDPDYLTTFVRYVDIDVGKKKTTNKKKRKKKRKYLARTNRVAAF